MRLLQLSVVPTTGASAYIGGLAGNLCVFVRFVSVEIGRAHALATRKACLGAGILLWLVMEPFSLTFAKHLIYKSFLADLIRHFLSQVSIIGWPLVVNQGPVVVERPTFLIRCILLEEICVCDPSELLCWDSTFP